MRKTANTLATAIVIATSITMTPAEVSLADSIEEGKKIAFNRTKGNCLACHAIKDKEAELPGTMGPPLLSIKQRYSREKLKNHIFDATKASPNTSMPPFGKYKILTDDEIDKVVDYVMTL